MKKDYKRFVVSLPYHPQRGNCTGYPRVYDICNYSFAVEAHKRYSCDDIIGKMFNGVEKITVRLWDEDRDRFATREEIAECDQILRSKLQQWFYSNNSHLDGEAYKAYYHRSCSPVDLSNSKAVYKTMVVGSQVTKIKYPEDGVYTVIQLGSEHSIQGNGRIRVKSNVRKECAYWFDAILFQHI